MKQIKPKTSKGPAEWFTGDVYPTILLSGEEPSRVRLGRPLLARSSHCLALPRRRPIPTHC